MLNTVDLINNSWSFKDFNNSSFQIEKDPQDLQEKIKVVYRRKEEVPSSAGSLPPVVPLDSQQEDRLLTQVTQAFDDIVRTEIEKETAEIEGSDGATKKEKIEQQIQVLKRLISNLQSHDNYIREYNDNHYSFCPTHDETLKLIEGRFNLLLSEKKKEVTDQLTDRIKQMETKCKNKEGLDEWHLYSLSFSFDHLLENLHSPVEKELYRNKYHQLLNQAYVQTLTNQLKRNELPFTIQIMLTNLDFNQTAIEAAINKTAEKFITHLNHFSREHSLLDFKFQMQGELLSMLGKDLGLNSGQLEKLNQFLILSVENEEKFSRSYDKALYRAKHALRESFEEGAANAINNYYPRPEFAFFPAALKYIKQTMDFPPKQFSSYLTKLEKSFSDYEETIQQQLDGYARRLAARFVTTTYKTKRHLWEERNAAYRKFSFNQVSWGENAILGKGVCAAINYRWIRELLKDPSKKITSHKDLDSDASKAIRNKEFIALFEKIKQKIEQSPAIDFAKAQLRKKEGLTPDEMDEFEVPLQQPFLTRQDSSIGVKPEDRRIQAQYKVEKQDKIGAIPKQILTKDHLLARRLIEEKPSTIKALIENVMAKDKEDSSLLERSSGIFGISIYRSGARELRAHALGMQIDQQSGIYRFWDVNSGFYSYPNLETLKREAEAYIHDYYGKDEQGIEYNEFLAKQYYRAGS